MLNPGPSAVLWTILLGTAILLAGAPLAATSYVMMPDTTLVDQASLVVVARVLEAEPDVDPARGLPATVYTVAVERLLKGEPPDGPLRIRVPGVAASDAPGGEGFHVFGAPRLEEDGPALLFLVPRPDGAFTPLHLMLGVFHQRDGMALRDLSQTHEVVSAGRLGAAATDRRPRDFDRFTAWVENRARGWETPADYRLDMEPEAVHRLHQPFQLFEDQGGCDSQRLPIRWFKFDDGQSARWQANASGQPGMDGGGFSQFQNALALWQDDPGSTILLTYLGTTTRTSGAAGGGADALIVFDDPLGDIGGSFECATGGVLAIGGPSFRCAPRSFGGQMWREAVAGRVVTQDGAGCYYGTDDDENGEEVFAHEIGHTLGLAHSRVAGALMRASAYGDGRGASLGSDDRAAIQLIYGDGSGGGDGGGDGGGGLPPLPTRPAAPSALEATTQSESRIRLTWRDNSTDEDRFEVLGSVAGGAFDSLGSIGAGATAANVIGLDAATDYAFRVRACNTAGCSDVSNTATARTLGSPDANPRCSQDPSALCLAQDRFAVEVDWINQHRAGDTGRGTPVTATDDSGFFWFFDPANLELVTKVLDGSPINGHFWFFYGALSDVEYTLRVTDTRTGNERTYRNPAGNLCGQGDATAFPADAASTGEPVPGVPADSNPPDPGSLDGVEVTDAGMAGPCTGDPGALCLLNDRFRVTVEWDNPRQAGDQGQGRAVPRTDNTGTFWFFDANNIELVVKMIDGTAVNGKHWFFYGALSDVEYTIRVEDLETGAVRRYVNPAGNLCGRGDTQAF